MSPSAIAVGRILASSLGLLTAPIVARALGPEGRGETAAISAVLMIVPILLAVGLPLRVRELALRLEASEVMTPARMLVFMAMLPAFVIGLLLVNTVFVGLETESRVAAVVAITLSPTFISVLCDQSLLIVRQDYGAVAILQVAQPVSYAGLIVAGAFAHTISVPFAIWTMAIGSAVAALTGVFLTRVELKFGDLTVLQLFRGGLRYSGSMVAEATSNRLDQVVSLPILGAAQAGLYSVAVTFGTLPLITAHVIGVALYKKAGMATPEDREGIYASSARFSLIAAAAVAVPLMAAVPLLVPWLFGDEFSAAIPATLVALAGGVALSVGYAASQMLASAGRGIEMTVAQGLGVVIGIAALFALAVPLGAMGAAIASSIGYLVSVFVLWLRLPVRPKHLRFRPTDLWDLYRLVRRGAS